MYPDSKLSALDLTSLLPYTYKCLTNLSELEIFVQPIFDRNSRPIAYESFVRLKSLHLPIYKFFDLWLQKHEYSILESIQSVILRKTLTVASASSSSLWVNLHPICYMHKNYLESMIEVVNNFWPYSKDLLAIEIHENWHYYINKFQLLQIIEIIRDNGLKVILDDIDRVHRDKNLLEGVEFDIAKVDLTRFNIDKDKEDIYRFLCYLRERCGCRVCAEKVETQEQFTRSYDLGCHYFQGYFLSIPSLVG